MKHLVFDVRHVESRIDGLGRYIVNLLNHLDTGKIRVTLLCKNDFPKEFLAHKESFSYVFLNVSLRNPIQNIEIYNLFKKLQVDVYFNPFIDGPLFTSAKRNVFAVHDLNHYFFSPIAATERSYAILYAKAAINIMALSYSSVIVFSDFVAKQVLQNTLVKKDMIKTIYHGFADFAINSKGNLPPYLNEQSYFLYVGNNRPHKNLKSLIDAFALSGLHERGYSLVIAGNQIPRFYDAREHINSKGINSVYIVESPSNEDLGSLYSNCLSVIYPSFSEGFGFPLLEAWNYKKPILCANASCLPEIGGDAALYFDPLSIEDISTTLKTIANDEKLREKLSYSGSERLLSFNWKSSAQKHLDVFLN